MPQLADRNGTLALVLAVGFSVTVANSVAAEETKRALGGLERYTGECVVGGEREIVNVKEVGY